MPLAFVPNQFIDWNIKKYRSKLVLILICKNYTEYINVKEELFNKNEKLKIQQNHRSLHLFWKANTFPLSYAEFSLKSSHGYPVGTGVHLLIDT